MPGCLFVLSGGCAPPSVDLFDQTARPTSAPAKYDDRDWATVLRENVKDGLVDYDHLGDHAAPLERYLALVALVGPLQTPDRFASGSARLAYYLNAYNAGVLRAVLYEQVPATMHDVRRPSLEHGYRLLVDGRPMTLAELRQAARKESLGDARIEFCLCDAARGSPPLRDQPYRPGVLEEQLAAAAREAMDNPNLVMVDHERERLNVALVIQQHRQEFLDSERRQTGTNSPTVLGGLLHLAGGMRRQWLNTAAGYELGVIPFDRSLNRWAARATTDSGGD
ncbi:MAG: DUF547 domain-containing protein [Planctomycetes bacterium]|nr:DUF547 domain-containing protein [Planctomycetota bacterium]